MKASDNEFPKLLFVEGAAPATPAAGQVVAYAKTDGLLYAKDDVGTETPLGGGGGGGGGGDVVGPASAVDDRIATFDGTTGKAIQDSGKTLADLRVPVVQSVTSSATVTPAFGEDLVKVTAQAAALALANPSGTAIPAWGFAIRIKDNGTARAISYGTQYRAIGVTLPATTVIGKTLYLGGIWNSDDSKLDIVAVAQEA